jgi:hypothetical protein
MSGRMSGARRVFVGPAELEGRARRKGGRADCGAGELAAGWAGGRKSGALGGPASRPPGGEEGAAAVARPR